MSNIQAQQRIVRLTPLDQALAALDAVMPAAAREIMTGAALGRALAADVVGSARPAEALALQDGWAVRSEFTLDASSYAPALLPAIPVRVDLGDPLPPGADAVAPLETLVVCRRQAQALAPVASGDGVLLPGGDVSDGKVLRHAGERLCATDMAVLMAANIAQVSVREPRIHIVRAGKRGPVIEAAVGLVAHSVESGGGSSRIMIADSPDTLEETLHDTTPDAFILVGGTGIGRHDASVTTVRRIGRLVFHGVGLAPAETLAFGWIGMQPVLLLPGRLDAALAGWLVLGQRLLARLCGCADQDEHASFELSRKVTSTIGKTEIVPVRRRGQTLEPLASGYLPLSSLVSDGWIQIPPESEGHPAGTWVAMRPWP